MRWMILHGTVFCSSKVGVGGAAEVWCMVNLLRIIFISLKVIKFLRTGETGRKVRGRFLNFALSHLLLFRSLR